MTGAIRSVLLVSLLLVGVFTAHAGEYDFDIPEAEKTNWEFGGKLELRYTHHQLDQDSAAYKLRFPEGDVESLDEWRPLLELKASYNLGDVNLFLTTHHEYEKTYWGEEWFNKVYEAYASFKPTSGIAIDVGKKNYLWGKGYAWNPAGFINRAKDPDDPELNLEGYTALSLDYIKSFSDGIIETLAVTPVILPVFSWENDELGEQGDINFAVKTYLLIYDTDLDFMYFVGPNQPSGFGLDFSRNITENLEVHGELALRLDAEKTVLDTNGGRSTFKEDQWSWLLGGRFLTRYDTTFILEYYHNGAGYGLEEIDDFFDFQAAAYQRYLTTGRKSQLGLAARAAGIYYSQRNYGRDYIYLKISQKEPFDILYFIPYLTTMINLGDGSFNLTPGFTYQPWTNIELGWKMMIPVGPNGTEYGEKQDDWGTEAMVRFYF
jgi:hypothetical protein